MASTNTVGGDRDPHHDASEIRSGSKVEDAAGAPSASEVDVPADWDEVSQTYESCVDRPELLREAVEALEPFARLELYSANSPEECALIIVPISKRDVDVARALFPRLSAALAPGAAEKAVDDMERRKDAAYEERNKVVAALAHLFPSGIAKTDIPGWTPEWHGCVYIDLPTGQVSWHYHDSQAWLFDELPPYDKPWDGHDTDEKYRRLGMLGLSAAGALAPGAAVPEGFVLVPVELPHEAVSAVLPMYAEMLPDSEFPFTINLWRSLLAALAARPTAPPPPAEQPGSAEPVAPAEAAPDAGLVEKVARIIFDYFGPHDGFDYPSELALTPQVGGAARAVLAAILPPIRDAERAEELERCAKIAEQFGGWGRKNDLLYSEKIAAAIRGRNKETSK